MCKLIIAMILLVNFVLHFSKDDSSSDEADETVPSKKLKNVSKPGSSISKINVAECSYSNRSQYAYSIEPQVAGVR